MRTSGWLGGSPMSLSGEHKSRGPQAKLASLRIRGPGRLVRLPILLRRSPPDQAAWIASSQHRGRRRQHIMRIGMAQAAAMKSEANEVAIRSRIITGDSGGMQMGSPAERRGYLGPTQFELARL